MISYLFSFSGRIGRAKWWGAQAIVATILIVCLGFLGLSVGDTKDVPLPALLAFVAILLLASWINLASMSKRYHDRNKSAFWILICLIPFGSLWQLIECGFLSGDYGDNDYGDGPDFDISDEINKIAGRSQPKPSNSFAQAQNVSAMPQPSFGQSKPLFGGGR